MLREFKGAFAARILASTLGLAALGVVTVAASGLLSSAGAAEESGKFLWVKTPAPAVGTTFKDAAGADKTLADFKGKTLVVNFWATWCGPCVKEMPLLDALQAKMGGAKFQVLTISQDREGEKVAKPFFEKNNWKNLALFMDPPGRFQKDAKLRGLPTTLIVDKNGLEVARVEGEANWTSAAVEAELRKAMAQ